MVREDIKSGLRSRKVLDCRSAPQSECSLALSGTEEEVLNAGIEHAVSKHGSKNTPELRDQLRGMMKDE